MTEIKTEDERVDLRAIITKHVVVGGYPNTMGIARDAFELGRSLSLHDELVEALELLSDALLGLSGMAGLITEKGVDRVLVDGEWHEGPLATAYIETVREIASGADRVLTQSQARSLLTRIRKSEIAKGRCANCGEIRSAHLVGLYRLWCPDEKQPDMLPDGTWKLGAKPLAFGVVKGVPLKAGHGVGR